MLFDLFSINHEIESLVTVILTHEVSEVSLNHDVLIVVQLNFTTNELNHVSSLSFVAD
ncbi:MAG: hypothetical protein U9Q66_03075 [Patescibacteria group bacterium]|nr:hypothetical protein [Patescibacteria group bacterium]